MGQQLPIVAAPQLSGCILYGAVPKSYISLFILFCNKCCNFVTKMLNLIYKTSQNQKAELIKSGLVIEEFGRLNNYAIESKKYVMDEPRFSFTQYL